MKTSSLIRRRLSWLAGVSFACLQAAVLELKAADPVLAGVREEHVLIPMRDGARLSAYLYFPEGSGPWPVIFEQRYSNVRSAAARQWYASLAKNGYVAAVVNFRGSQLSEGRWIYHRALGWGEKRDGYDLCEWFAAQPWSTGRVGTFGSSQGGTAQNFLAVTQPPSLVAQYVIDAEVSRFHDASVRGGAFRPERHLAMAAVLREPAQQRELMEEWYRHQTYDAYWHDEDTSRHFDRMNVPCFTIGSWYDYACAGSVKTFLGRQYAGGPGSRGRQQIVLGPWVHGYRNKGTRAGELTYPEHAAFDVGGHMVRWFNHWLKGIDNGVQNDPPVRYFVMGAAGEPGAPGNVWRTSADWPVAASLQPYFLQPGGGLSIEAPGPSGGHTAYRSDPLNPAPIPGRNFPGARDAREYERHPDVRTFTTAPLQEPVEWTGLVQAEFYVSSSARDTDFIVRISDVYPDGRSILIMDAVRRARYRSGFETIELMEPGKVYKVAFEVGWLSQIFNAGHRIRVTVASTGAPFYEPNPQTGEALTIDFPAEVVTATNTIHHAAGAASRVLVPVRPGAQR